MKLTKIASHHLWKCYSLAGLHYQGKVHVLAASEKQGPCMMFRPDGEYEETVWEEPGGVMSMEQIPGSDGTFLATQRFYSPNDSAKAAIVLASPGCEGEWQVRTLAKLPFVHRFGILERGGIRYLIAATLKSAHAFQNDWTCPGRIWACELPEDLNPYDENHPLPLKPIMSGLYHNHGFCKGKRGEYTYACVGTDQGVYRCIPPESRTGEWTTVRIAEEAASDVAFLSAGGKPEAYMAAIQPFHGDCLKVYVQEQGCYKPIHTFSEKYPFLHAIWGCQVKGTPVIFLGNREGERNLMALTCGEADGGELRLDILEQGAGSANVLVYSWQGQDYLISANREKDELAFYIIEN